MVLVQWFDSVVLDWFVAHREPLLTPVMKVFTMLGEGGFIWILIGVTLLFWKQTRRTGVVVLLSLLLCVLFCNGILKNVVARPRPCWRNPELAMLTHIPSDYSFPSGHSASSFAAATCLCFKSRRGGLAALFMAAAIAASRMYFYVHYPTDILAGILVGILMAFLAEWIIRVFEKKSS